MRVNIFWPWLTRHRMRFEGEGGDALADGSGDGPDGGGTATLDGDSWHSEFSYFDDNPDAVKAFSKYKSIDEALKGGHEAMKMTGQPYRLPADVSKLSDEQRSEIDGFVRGLRGVPESAEGYEFKVPEDATIDGETLESFKSFAHEKGLSPQVAQELVDFQLSFVGRLNEARNEAITKMTNANYKAWKDTDCGGDKELAATRMENVKKYLQMQFRNEDGTPDTEGWEKFAARIMHNDRVIELPLLRALHEAAQFKVATGGSLMGTGGNAKAAPSGLQYPEMRKGKS